MHKMFSLEFKFKDQLCFAIIRTIKKNETTKYKVRIMNSRLDCLISGNNTFTEVNGELLNELRLVNTNESRLRSVICEGLSNYLKNNHSQPELKNQLTQ